jgi:hypothetical protein
MSDIVTDDNRARGRRAGASAVPAVGGSVLRTLVWSWCKRGGARACRTRPPHRRNGGPATSSTSDAQSCRTPTALRARVDATALTDAGAAHPRYARLAAWGTGTWLERALGGDDALLLHGRCRVRVRRRVRHSGRVTLLALTRAEEAQQQQRRLARLQKPALLP